MLSATGGSGLTPDEKQRRLAIADPIMTATKKPANNSPLRFNELRLARLCPSKRRRVLGASGWKCVYAEAAHHPSLANYGAHRFPNHEKIINCYARTSTHPFLFESRRCA